MFRKVNLNPKKRKAGDCVIRAVAGATNKEWAEVQRDLVEIAIKKAAMPNAEIVYKAYVKQLGFEEQKPMRNEYNDYLSVEALSRTLYSNVVALVHTRRHLTLVVANTIYDTWDTSKENAFKYYTKKVTAKELKAIKERLDSQRELIRIM